MKIMKITKFYANIKQNNENHKKYIIPLEKYENHENPKTQCLNKTKIMKILEFLVGIKQITIPL